MNIGILGGTFDPIHIGHMKMAQAAVNELARLGKVLDKVLIIPAGCPYFKDGITSYNTRCDMVALAVDELNAINLIDTSNEDCADLYELSLLESDETRPSYTYETLGKIHEIYPGAEIFFICGADVFKSIMYWKNPRAVLKEATLTVFNRQEDPGTIDGAKVIYMEEPVPPVSSTQIRKAVQTGGKIDSLVSVKVAEYISRNGLYR